MRKRWMQMPWKSMSVVLIAAAAALMTQLPVAAQEAQPNDGQMVLAQATPEAQRGQEGAERILPFVLLGGSFQIVDNTGGVCLGQCRYANPLTNACTCPEGFTDVDSARILLDVQGSTTPCGSILVMCLK